MSKYNSQSFTESPSKYFKTYEWEPRQELIEDLIMGALKQNGINFLLIPKENFVRDDLFGDDLFGKYEKSLNLIGYVKNVDSFEGQGDIFSRFGLSIADSMTVTISKKQWTEVQQGKLEVDRKQPMDGDLLWFPVFNKMFEITHVEREPTFYQFGKLYTFDLQCELYKFNQDEFDTGVDFIDDLNDYNRDTAPANLVFENDEVMSTESGEEIVSQNYSIEDKDNLANNTLIQDKIEDIVDFGEKSPFTLGDKW